MSINYTSANLSSIQEDLNTFEVYGEVNATEALCYAEELGLLCMEAEDILWAYTQGLVDNYYSRQPAIYPKSISIGWELGVPHYQGDVASYWKVARLHIASSNNELDVWEFTRELIMSTKDAQHPGALYAGLLDMARALVEYFLSSTAEHLVLLGRDSWPLVPILREKYGIPAQYFIYSRLQIGDSSTHQAWAEEVQPNSLVFDTGYMGSIFDEIKKIDSTAEYILGKSNNRFVYRGLRTTLDAGHTVKELEAMPKILTRCASMEVDGYARCPADTRDSDEISGMTASIALEFNKELCKYLDISPDWAAWTGQTREERLNPPK